MGFQPVSRAPDLESVPDGPSIWVFLRGDSLLSQDPAVLPLVTDGGGLYRMLARPVFTIGTLDGVPCHAVDLGDSGDAAGADEWCKRIAPWLGQSGKAVSFVTLRQVLLATAGDSPHWRAASCARHLAEWRRTSRYCGVCGTGLVMQQSDVSYVCPSCGQQWWPRVTPAVIVAVTDGERILLGHNVAFRPGLYAPFAGFVEPGESLEEACKREVHEESGVQITGLAYHASQHWPFPGSLMIAFTACYTGGTPRADGIELSEVRWFGRDEAPPGVPGPGGMGRSLYDWFMRGGGKDEGR